MFFFKKSHPALTAFGKGDTAPLLAAASQNEDWRSNGGLSPSQLVKYLLKSDSRQMDIPVYTRGEGRLRFLSEMEFEKIFGIQHTPQLIFNSVQTLDDIAKRTRKQSFSEEARLKNKWTRALLLRQREKNELAPGAIKWVDNEVGYGVFAYKDLPEYTYIGEYTGLVRKRAPRKDQFNNYVFRYVTGIKDAPYVIDARESGNFTRFINHSDHPNLTSRWIIVDGITHIIFFTNAFMKRGTQMTYDYGENYWKSRRFPRLL